MCRMSAPTGLPVFISTEADLQRVVQLGSTPETIVLEFKTDLNAWRQKEKAEKRKAQKETCRDISAFANHLGGCILVGVSEKKHGDATVADECVGLDDIDGRTKWIGQAIRNYLVPSTMSLDVVPVIIGGKSLLALNIRASRDLVALWDREDHTVEYLRRTPHGKEWMNPDEALRHALDASRMKKLAFLEAKARVTGDSIVELVSGVDRLIEAHGPNMPYGFARVHNAIVNLGQVGNEDFELRVTVGTAQPRNVLIPYGALRHAWVTTVGRLGLHLELQLVHTREDEIVLERIR